MNARAANAYRRVDLSSAPKHDIVGRLFERFLADVATARKAIANKDIATKASAIDHALRIVAELEASLDHAAAPEVSANLQALYRYVADRLCVANAKLESPPLDDATRVMTDLGHAFRGAPR